MSKKDFLKVGKILNTHGVRGEVKIDSLSDKIDDFCRIPKMFLDENAEALEISAVRQHKNHVLVKFEGINTFE